MLFEIHKMMFVRHSIFIISNCGSFCLIGLKLSHTSDNLNSFFETFPRASQPTFSSYFSEINNPVNYWNSRGVNLEKKRNWFVSFLQCHLQSQLTSTYLDSLLCDCYFKTIDW